MHQYHDLKRFTTVLRVNEFAQGQTIYGNLCVDKRKKYVYVSRLDLITVLLIIDGYFSISLLFFEGSLILFTS